jgi:bifunctional UDP-N-acetylglucosamine pyrophosphorylase/glucosamine-1-phosphate N-acetyltransferase
VYALQPPARRFLENTPSVFPYVEVGVMPPHEHELAASVQAMLEASETVRAVLTEGFFVDVDKPWHILGATRRVLDDLFDRLEGNRIADSARIHDGAEINGRLVLGEGSVIGNRVVIKGDLWVGKQTHITNGAIIGGRTIIGHHARVREYCLVGGHCALGDHTICGHGAELEGVIFDRCYLYHYCEMAGVFGSAVDIGAASVCGTLRFDDGSTVFNIKGRKEIPPYGANCTYMGDYSRTGVNAILMPGVRIGAYSCVGPGVILYEDLPSRKLILAKQEYVIKDWGPERYGW